MAVNMIPTSRDIYLEVNGKKVAVVQGYTAQTTRSSTTMMPVPTWAAMAVARA